MSLFRLVALAAFVTSAVLIALHALPILAAVLIPAGLAAFVLVGSGVDKEL